jgi:hypothetical protein
VDIGVLLAQKLAGNTSESGFKLAVWGLVVEELANVTKVGLKKNVKQCKANYQ